MRYKVAFRKRFSPEGEPLDNPRSLVSPADGVIQDEEFVEILEPAGMGVSEDLSEDEGFLGLGSETWVFDVAEGREREFTDALVASRVVLDFEEVPDESLTT
jgi:hypothetical protein